MASSKVRHDFAPAWLKLPHHENMRPMTPRNVGNRAFDRSYSDRAGVTYHLDAGYDDVFMTPRAPRQRSSSSRTGINGGCHSNGADVKARGRTGRNGRNFNHDVNGSDYDVINNDWLRKGPSPSFNDSPYGERFHTSFQAVGRNIPEKKSVRAKDPAVLTTEDEFPSLNGDLPSDSGKASYSKVASVWDGAVRESNVVVRPLSELRVKPPPLMKINTTNKWTYNDVDKVSRPSSSTVLAPGSNKQKTQRNGHREPSAMMTAKVLNACLKQPKEDTSRKSGFFRLMRRESHESSSDVSTTESSGSLNAHVDGTQNKGVIGDDAAVTSSQSSAVSSPTRTTPVEVVFSSEGELKLMIEMGWKETDYEGDDCEITDEEVREFEELCRRLKEQQLNWPDAKKNGLSKKNGYLDRILNSLPVDRPSSSVGSDFSDASDSSDS